MNSFYFKKKKEETPPAASDPPPHDDATVAAATIVAPLFLPLSLAASLAAAFAFFSPLPPAAPHRDGARRSGRGAIAGGGGYRLSSASSSRSRFPIVVPATAAASENNDNDDDDIHHNVRGRRNGARTGGDNTAMTTTAARGGRNSPPRRNDDGPPRPPLHCRPPAAGHAASRRCNHNGRSIPLPPSTPQHGPSSPFAIVDARTGGTETAVAQGTLALRILSHDKRGEGRAMTMMKLEFEKSPDDNQPPCRGRGRQPHCWARRESGVSRGTGGGITFGRIPNDNQLRLGDSAAAPGEGGSATTPGVGGLGGAPGEEARRRWSRRSSCPSRRSCKVARRRGTSSNDVVVT
jgi:hypothetical protein